MLGGVSAVVTYLFYQSSALRSVAVILRRQLRREEYVIDDVIQLFMHCSFLNGSP